MNLEVILGLFVGLLVAGVIICTINLYKDKPAGYCIVYAEQGTPVTLDDCDVVVE